MELIKNKNYLLIVLNLQKFKENYILLFLQKRVNYFNLI